MMPRGPPRDVDPARELIGRLFSTPRISSRTLASSLETVRPYLHPFLTPTTAPFGGLSEMMRPSERDDKNSDFRVSTSDVPSPGPAHFARHAM